MVGGSEKIIGEEKLEGHAKLVGFILVMNIIGLLKIFKIQAKFLEMKVDAVLTIQIIFQIPQDLLVGLQTMLQLNIDGNIKQQEVG